MAAAATDGQGKPDSAQLARRIYAAKGGLRCRAASCSLGTMEKVKQGNYNRVNDMSIKGYREGNEHAVHHRARTPPDLANETNCF